MLWKQAENIETEIHYWVYSDRTLAWYMLNLPVPCISEGCIKTKILIFTLLCGAAKDFVKVFKAFFLLVQDRDGKG